MRPFVLEPFLKPSWWSGPIPHRISPVNVIILFIRCNLHDIDSPWSVPCLRNLKVHTIPFVWLFICVSHNPRVVDKHIRSILTTDKPIALRVVEPLDYALQLTSLRQRALFCTCLEKSLGKVNPAFDPGNQICDEE